MVSFFLIEKTTFRSVFANNSVFNLHFYDIGRQYVFKAKKEIFDDYIVIYGEKIKFCV